MVSNFFHPSIYSKDGHEQGVDPHGGFRKNIQDNFPILKISKFGIGLIKMLLCFVVSIHVVINFHLMVLKYDNFFVCNLFVVPFPVTWKLRMRDYTQRGYKKWTSIVVFFLFEGTLMLIWKSPCLFYFIIKVIPLILHS